MRSALSVDSLSFSVQVCKPLISLRRRVNFWLLYQTAKNKTSAEGLRLYRIEEDSHSQQTPSLPKDDPRRRGLEKAVTIMGCSELIPPLPDDQSTCFGHGGSAHKSLSEFPGRSSPSCSVSEVPSVAVGDSKIEAQTGSVRSGRAPSQPCPTFDSPPKSKSCPTDEVLQLVPRTPVRSQRSPSSSTFAEE